MERKLRRALVTAGLDLVRSGLNRGTAGNISVRVPAGMLITPSGVPPHDTTPTMIVAMGLVDKMGLADNPDAAMAAASLKPSSEWRFHRDIFLSRPDVGAIVHTHSLYATILATQHRAIPALHYMIAAFGAPTIRCTPYAPFGTQDLSDLIIDHLGASHGVLLGNHGMIATGAHLDQAMWRAEELETLAKTYVLATIGGGAPVILSDAEVEKTIARFADYGMTAKPSAEL